MTILSVDHIRVFLTIVEKGSFSAASRSLLRSQTAISYAISNLESHLEVQLFERDGRRPTLTSAGAALVVHARKVVQSLETLKGRAGSIARGLEPELAVVIEAYFPVDDLIAPLRDFALRFPQVQLQLHREMVGTAIEMVANGRCALGIVSEPAGHRYKFQQIALPQSIKLLPVVAKDHPLAQSKTELHADDLAEHIQIVSILNIDDDEIGVFSPRLWRCSDLRIQRASLLAGVGWTALPHHMAVQDIEAGLVVPIEVAGFNDPRRSGFRFSVIHLFDEPLGPAATWLSERLSAATEAC